MLINLLTLFAFMLACTEKKDNNQTADTSDVSTTNGDFSGPAEGEWVDENPYIISDNCELAYEDPSQPVTTIVSIEISDVQVDTFTITFPFENDVSWQENEIAPSATCSWTTTGNISCNNPEYMNRSLAEFFEGEAESELENLTGNMIGSLEVEGSFSDDETLEGTFINGFTCEGADCASMDVPNPCLLEKGFSVVLTNPSEE